MRSGIFRVGAPRLEVLYEIVLGGSRGIVWLMPIVLIFPAVLIVTRKRLPDVAILSAALPLPSSSSMPVTSIGMAAGRLDVANLVAATTDMFTPNEDVAGAALFTWLMPMFLSGAYRSVVFQPLPGVRFAALGLYVAVVGALAAATFLSLRSTAA